MIGYYGYGIALTYLGVVSATIGINLALKDNIVGAIICLIVSGICDMFDGTVARLKERTKQEEHYGIEIDSLADLVCFGVFPTIIGYSLGLDSIYHVIIYAMYILAALIRLAYFNVTQAEITSISNEPRRYYVGLPVTCVACIIPLIYLISHMCNWPYEIIYAPLLLIISVAFVSKFKIAKPRFNHLIIFLLVGVISIMALLYIGGRLR